MTKGNNGKGNIPSRDEWQTPQKLWDKLNNQYFFTFDCCANKYNRKVNDFSMDLSIKTPCGFGLCWMNPPFSKAYEMFKTFFRVVTKGIAIYRCDNIETKLWQEEIFPNASWVFIPSKRIAY